MEVPKAWLYPGTSDTASRSASNPQYTHSFVYLLPFLMFVFPLPSLIRTGKISLNSVTHKEASRLYFNI